MQILQDHLDLPPFRDDLCLSSSTNNLCVSQEADLLDFEVHPKTMSSTTGYKRSPTLLFFIFSGHHLDHLISGLQEAIAQELQVSDDLSCTTTLEITIKLINLKSISFFIVYFQSNIRYSFYRPRHYI